MAKYSKQTRPGLNVWLSLTLTALAMYELILSTTWQMNDDDSDDHRISVDDARESGTGKMAPRPGGDMRAPDSERIAGSAGACPRDSLSAGCSCRSREEVLRMLSASLRMLSASPLEASFCRCAFVGGSQSLLGMELGRQIDAHDTVIRINRLPQPEDVEDLGKKTDIYFAGPGWNVNDAYYLSRDGGTYLIQEVGQTSLYDKPCSILKGGANCRFAALILTSAYNFLERYPLDRPGWRPNGTAFPVGYLCEQLNGDADELVRTKLATRGLRALLTFAPVCGSVKLYGLSGLGTFDGHGIDHVHNLTLEHAFLERIIRGSLSEDDLSTLSRKRSLPLCELQSLGHRDCIKHGKQLDQV